MATDHDSNNRYQQEVALAQGPRNQAEADGGGQASTSVEVATMHADDPVPAELVMELAEKIKETAARNRARLGGDGFGNDLSPIGYSLPPAPPLPDGALGPRLDNWARAVQTLSGGTPLDLCALTLLGACGFALQGMMDVRAFTSPAPISVYLLLVAACGEGKTAVFTKVMEPIREVEERLTREYEQLVAELKSKGLKDEAEALPQPVLYVDEATPAALRYFLRVCRGAVGFLLDEAGSLLGGHGMGKETRLQMVTNLAKLFDATPVKFVRVKEGIVVILNRRFSMTLLSQWNVASPFIADMLCRSQGLHSRILLAFPDSTMGRRHLLPCGDEAAALAVHGEYHRWMLDILNCPPHIIDGTLNEIRPPVMELARDAREMLTSFGKEMQKYMLRIGRDNPLGEHVNKMPAISVRLAAILKLIEEGSSANLGAEHANVKWLLGADHLARGIALTRYFIKEKERLSEPGPVTQKLEDARLLLSWLREVGKTSFTRSEVYKNASKHRLRDKAVLDDVIALLMDYGHLQEIELPRKLGAAKAAKKYQLTEEGLDALHVEQIA